jgi:chromosomal replication initiator protein
MAQAVMHEEQNLAALMRSKLIERIGTERYELWIAEDTRWSFSDGILAINFSSEFACQLCRKTLGSEIQRVFEQVLSQPAGEIRYGVFETVGAVFNEQHSNHKIPRHQNNRIEPHQRCNMGGKDLLRPDSGYGDRVDHVEASVAPKDMWTHIVHGEGNHMALSAVKMALAEPGKVTPVVVHGPTGTGKSLFLSSLAQYLRNHRRLRRVIHMTSEQFTNDFTEGLRGGGLPVFRRKYRDVEAFLLDDVQFLLGKKSTIAEARHTIDNLLRCGKQVVVSSDRPLQDLEGLGSELIGRLRGGLVVPLFPLDLSMKVQLLSRLTNSAGLQLSTDILEQLAERIGGDGRLIRGAVHRLVAVAANQPGKLTWDQCWTAVFDLVQAHRPVVRLVDIERTICSMFGLQQDSLQSNCKTRSVSQPRMLAMFLARKYTSAAYKEIGDYFGRRRHSTVISAEKTVEAWLQENAQLEGIRSVHVRDAIRHVEAQLQVG